MESQRPKVGIGVIVLRDGKVLIGERLSSHGAGTWQLPGGHLEFGETFEETARREVYEETGLKDIDIAGLVSVYNERDYGKHYINLSVLAHSDSGEPYAREPEKARNWSWVDPAKLPDSMYIASRKSIENWLAGTLYSD